MSLRAIKKQQNNQNQFSTTTTAARQNLFRKYQTQSNQLQPKGCQSTSTSSSSSSSTSASAALNKQRKEDLLDLRQQNNLLGRLTHSNPELKSFHYQNQQRQTTATAQQITLRRKSENDITTLIAQCRNNILAGGTGILNAQSEVCLKTISSHYYNNNNNADELDTNDEGDDDAVDNKSEQKQRNMSSARSHKDLSQSYNATIMSTSTSTSRRMSESSLGSSSNYSQQHQHQHHRQQQQQQLQANTATTTTAPTSMTICGYEIIEERARFTVYKLRVENQNNCWLVLRRYTDFVRLKNKIENAFPRVNLTLPRKKIFGDNFNSVFLDNRVQGLQMFVNAVMAREELRACKIVREFFCLDEPPSYSESMEECRAIFEAQEETISLLKTQISSKNDLILNLQKKLRDELIEKEKLKKVLCTLPTKLCANCSTKLNVELN